MRWAQVWVCVERPPPPGGPAQVPTERPCSCSQGNRRPVSGWTDGASDREPGASKSAHSSQAPAAVPGQPFLGGRPRGCVDGGSSREPEETLRLASTLPAQSRRWPPCQEPWCVLTAPHPCSARSGLAATRGPAPLTVGSSLASIQPCPPSKPGARSRVTQGAYWLRDTSGIRQSHTSPGTGQTSAHREVSQVATDPGCEGAVASVRLHP